ncbi:hypothetical protein GCM10010466_35920 [Planomonospora alba]|uniref:Uncharacterized protein n=1 Tax=Planomonospora alba TaxID=161354 RepID=A0ABP6NAK3_9ACTN
MSAQRASDRSLGYGRRSVASLAYCAVDAPVSRLRDPPQMKHDTTVDRAGQQGADVRGLPGPSPAKATPMGGWAVPTGS